MSKEIIASEYFVLKFNFWCTKLFGRTYPIKKDLRYNCHACCEYVDGAEPVLIYNPRKLAKWSKAVITLGVFHEIGHLLFFKYSNIETKEDEIESEYLAELFAIRMMERHAEPMLKESLRFSRRVIKSNMFKKKLPIHYAAFIRIKEYQ